jgi:hypothetical protein
MYVCTRPVQTVKACGGSRGVAPLIFSLLNNTEVSGQFYAPAALHPGKQLPIPAEQAAGWAPELVRTLWGTHKPLLPAGIQTLDRPARSLVTVVTMLYPLPS